VTLQVSVQNTGIAVCILKISTVRCRPFMGSIRPFVGFIRSIESVEGVVLTLALQNWMILLLRHPGWTYTAMRPSPPAISKVTPEGWKEQGSSIMIMDGINRILGKGCVLPWTTAFHTSF
jgi:hypothetical protein